MKEQTICKFTTNAKDMLTLIKKLQSDIESAIGVYYIKAKADSISLGAQGYGRDNLFITFPAGSIDKEGEFLINDLSKVASWTKACTGVVSYTAFRDENDDLFLKLQNNGDINILQIDLFYDDEEIELDFPAISDRFNIDAGSVKEDTISTWKEINTTLKKAVKMSDSGLKAGELVVKSKSHHKDTYSKGEGYLEFNSVYRGEYSTTATVLKHKGPFGIDLKWDISSVQLKSLTNHVGNLSLIDFDDGTRLDDNGVKYEVVPALQLTSTIVLSDKSSEAKLDRQYGVEYEGNSIKAWVQSDKNDTVLFEDQNCKTFSTAESDSFLTACDKAWAIANDSLITISNTLPTSSRLHTNLDRG